METNYAGTLVSSRQDGKLAYTDNIFDKNINKPQSTINQEVNTFINNNAFSIEIDSRGRSIWNVKGKKYVLTPSSDDTPVVVDKKMYYGAGNTLPSSLGNNYITLNNGINSIIVEGPNQFLWIAVPNGLTVNVVGRDGMNMRVTLNESSTQIEGYTIYYRGGNVLFDECSFTITLQDE